ncbi:GMC family oxidoreductase [Frankia sp. CNm7]|uniref:Cholesterol oxidase n=1 Tax=Frankia nepalensis TaxID=1836974 RepID=A0A937RII9_9ACTN|nr:GMC oxidoreductase [Frankia nepalensis]MBL7497863.1 GMC family oxidoreductase [Frankia nepalensis]MBL7509686.1 GMC family oxidoreductase [Frankia nepalensis]MBL7517621.1 GMC family oxidoreductase [Frankia nepalensis]MBL7630817.1 GMC family oxidoreductase [Frankia nepalensis]
MPENASTELSAPTTTPSAAGVTRRRFAGTAGAGAALGAATLGGLVTGAGAARAATTEQRERVVVVGTGFGGGVTALRLAKAGVSALVLERGLRWPTGPNSNTFATLANLDNRSAWLSDRPPLPSFASLVPGGDQTWPLYTGVLEVIKGSGMTVNCGACVGGGSIMYHGMTLQPTKTNFAKSMPMAAGLYDELNQWCYPTVASMLGISTVPDDVLNTSPYTSSRIFLKVAPRSGLRTFRVPLPVDWNFVRGELSGQYNAAYTNSDIAFGVNNGGKHSIDVTYLAAAEATGKVRVETLHVVRDVALDANKKWVLSVDRIDTGGVVREQKRIIADAVFLNAGSPGTTRLLVKARAKNLIPNLPDAIGTQWGNNGDRIYEWVGMWDNPGTQQGGPACVGATDPNSPIPLTIIHAGAPPLLAGINRLMTVVGFGIVPAAGTWTYDAAKDDAKLTWPTTADAALQTLIAARMAGIALTGGGLMIDTNLTEPSTWHALGGVPMGAAVDLYGRVLGHRGLYVLDGARIPGSTGACNPSMTIAALAEHSMARIVSQDIGKIF